MKDTKKVILLFIFTTMYVISYCQVPRLFGNEDLKPCKEGKLYGFKNLKGDIVISCVYDYVSEYIDGLSCVRKDGKYGFIDKKGKIVIPLEYELAYNFSEGFSAVSKNNLWGHINRKGEIVTPLKYDRVGSFHEGVAWIKKGDKFGLVNKFGIKTTPCRYSSYIRGEAGYKHFYEPNFSEGLALVKKGMKWVYINKQGKTIFSLKTKSQPIPFMSWCYSDGVVWAYKKGHFLIIDKSGNILADISNNKNIDPNAQITKIGKFVNGFAMYKLDKGPSYLVNKKGEVVAVFDSKYNLYEKYQDSNTQLIFANWLYESYYDAYDWLYPTYRESHIEASFKHFKKLATEGNSRAQYVVGFMYQYGQGTPANEQEAIRWYEKSDEPDAKKQLTMLEGREDVSKPQIQNEPIMLAEQEYKEGNDHAVIANHNNYSTTETKIEIKDRINNVVEEKMQVVAQNNVQSVEPKKRKERIALVIGNAQYASKRLDTLNSPINDARNIGEKLDELGFEVRPVIENGSKRTMRKAIMDFINESRNYDVALFYYSGHGIQSKPGINATNYLIPSDAKLEYNESLPGECIDLNEMVIDNLSKERKGKASLVFIDACRTVLNLPSESDFVNTKGIENELRGLNEKQSPEGVCVVYATRAGSMSYETRKKTDNKDQNSYFTQGLLECLDVYKDKNLPIFIQYLKDKVRAKTNGKQLPSPYNELYGDFYFDPNK